MIKDIDLPGGIKVLGKSCFYNTQLQTITIPPSVTEICEQAFYKCKELREVQFEQNGNLSKIGMYAFAFTKIQKFVAPASL